MNTKTFFILILISAFVAITPLNAQYDPEAVERNRMARAKVRTQTEWTHDYVNGKPSDKGYRSSLTRYNTKGNKTEVVNYNSAGRMISMLTYQYDNRDRTISFERYDGDRKLKYSEKTVFDTKGNKARVHGFDGHAQYNNTFVYDDNNRLTEIRYTADNATVERRQFKYAGNKTEISIFDANNNLTFRQENTYSPEGLLILEVRTGGNGSVVHSLNMKYNSAGDMTEEVRRRADNRLDYQRNFQYDRSSRPLKIETANVDGSKFVSNEYQYNAQGDLISEAWKKNARNESSTKKYTYDSRGLYTEIDYYIATYKHNTLYKYIYELY